jgi:DNA-binding response OmpR family regulator
MVTQSPAGPRHVLVVDDEPHICRIIQYKLEQGPYEVSVCHDGLTALERLRRPEPIDLVLLDLMLPQVGGLEVLSELRRLEHRRETPVLVLTAKGDDSDRVQALALGVLDIVTKPFSPRKLRARVDDALSR